MSPGGQTEAALRLDDGSHRRLHPVIVALLLALGLHGYCLLVALAGAGVPRYLPGVWPLLVCTLGLAPAAVLPRSPRLAAAQGGPGPA